MTSLKNYLEHADVSPTGARYNERKLCELMGRR